ncbi:MAG: TonB family protein [Thermodesulfovibrionales bacterium]|nr:TonB family protein [Thermodesulfovibrionales bacterium]
MKPEEAYKSLKGEATLQHRNSRPPYNESFSTTNLKAPYPKISKKGTKNFIPKSDNLQALSPYSLDKLDKAVKQPPLADSLLTKKESPAIDDSKKKKFEDSIGGRLFDKEIIGKLAHKSEEDNQESSITFSTKEFRYQSYMERLKEKIERIWKYPGEAAERGIYGDLYIRFTILKNGRLGAVELLRTSGYKILDDAALKALRDAEPYWPLPDEWDREGLTITGHFIYTYYGGYIR